MRTLYNAARAADPLPRDQAVATLDPQVDELPGLDDRDRAILRFAIRLTLAPHTMRAARLDPLRAAGLDERAIHDVVQVVCCFSFMNRLADGTGVTLLPGRHALARELLGDGPLERHLAWGGGAASPDETAT